MISKVDKYRTESQVEEYSQEVLDLYSNSVGELNVSEKEAVFVKELASNCAGFFSDKDIFDTLKLLRANKLMSDDILANSRVYTVLKSLSLDMCENIKYEVEELTCNAMTKHVKDTGEIMSRYETKCFTIPSLESKIKIGENISNIIYKKNGAGIFSDVEKDVRPTIDFNINNLIILHKKEYSNGGYKEFVNVIIIPKLKLTNVS